MKELLFTFCITFFITIAVSAQCLNHDTTWTKFYNGSGNGADNFYDVKISRSGFVYVTGESHSLTSFGQDFITVKYSPQGIVIWERKYNGSNNAGDVAYSLFVDDLENIYVTGKSNSSGGAGFDCLTIKYDSAGNIIWSKLYNGTMNNNDIAYSIYVDQYYYVYVTGNASMSGNGNDYITIKYKPNGDLSWVRQYHGGTTADFASKIILDKDRNVYVTGYSGGGGNDGNDYLTIKYDSSGNHKWTARYNGTGDNDDEATGIGLDNLGNVYVTGKSLGIGGGNWDYVTIKYNSNGVEQWVRRYDGGLNQKDQANAIYVDTSGNSYVTGESVYNSGQGADYTTIKYDASGNILWNSKYDGPSHSSDIARVIVAGKNGELYVGGGSQGIGTGYDFLVIKYDQSNGDSCVFNRRSVVGGSSNENLFAMAIDDNHSCIYVTGETSGGGASYDGMTVRFEVFSILNLKEVIEGFYITSLNSMIISDSVDVLLRNTVSPYSIVDSARTVVNSTSLTGIFRFTQAQSGNYYIVHKHRNSMETWSRSGGEPFVYGSLMNYDFTNSNTKAYGNNLKLKGGRYCMYSGEIELDGVIDASDIVMVYNDVLIGQSGYIKTDIDGDEFVDVSDIILVYNNAINIVTIATP